MTLAIARLRLAGFRSYPQARIDAGPGIVALAGPNGAGKTNVLEAISLFAPGRGLRRAAPDELTRRPGGAGWSLSLLLGGAGDPVELWTGADSSKRRAAKIDDKATPALRFGRVLRLLWLTPALDRVFAEGPGERRRFLDRMTLSLDPDHAEASARYERAMRERNRLLRDGHDDPRWLAALEAQMAEHGVAVARARRRALAAIAGVQGETGGAFPRAAAALSGAFEQVLDADAPEEAFLRLLRNGRSRDAQAGRSLAGPHRSDLEVRYGAKDRPASECSTGEQKALLVSLVLANARALLSQIGVPPVLLFDEIAAHFDADRRAALFVEIAEMGAQAWLTGTEWSLFEALGKDAERFSVSDTPEGSRIERLG